MNRFSADFLVRPGCSLCDDAAPLVRRAVALAGGSVRVVDIDGDDDLVRDFGVRVPVLRVGDRIIAEGRISGVGRLWWRLARARFSRATG